jgi:hypothetical protein
MFMEALKIERTLDRLGLWKAISGVPGLIAIVLLSVTLTLFALSSLPTRMPVPAHVMYLSGVVLGVLFAVVGYYLGNFWDSVVFDPLYGRDGRWIARETRPLHLCPAGADLRRYRQSAMTALFPAGHSGEGVYREAESRAWRKRVQWARIEQPLVLSKFLRSLIWPFVGLTCALLVSGLWTFLSSPQRGSLTLLLLSFTTALITALLFVPYMNFRVEHMIRLYESVANEPGGRRSRGHA